MFNTFINSYRVAFAGAVNVFIFFLRRIPLLGKKIPESLYKQDDTKQMLGIIVQLLSMGIGFMKTGLYLGLMTLLPAFLYTGSLQAAKPKFIHILFFLSFVLGPLIKSTFLNKFNKKGYNMVVLMHADAREYYLGELLFKNITSIVYLAVPMLVIGAFIRLSPLTSLILTLEMIALRFVGELFLLTIYGRFKIIIAETYSYSVIVCVLAIAAAYVPPAYGKELPLEAMLVNPLVIVGIMIVGGLGLMGLFRYKGFDRLAKAILTKENIHKLGSIQKDSRFGDVKLKEKLMDKDNLDTRGSIRKSGYEYLNYLFFKRHRKMMMNPIKLRLGFVGAAFVAAIGVLLFDLDAKQIMLTKLPNSTHILVFVMYFMSTGERMCRAMFYNCDLSLLRYAYYRDGKVILSNFLARLKRVVAINLIPAVALCFALLTVAATGGLGDKLFQMIPVLVCVLCLSCFFSIHHLFMYYVIQPYTAELTVKSPLFRIVNMAVYMACFGSLQLKTTSYQFAFVVTFITVAYMGFALFMTLRLAPRTFRLK